MSRSLFYCSTCCDVKDIEKSVHSEWKDMRTSLCDVDLSIVCKDEGVIAYFNRHKNRFSDSSRPYFGAIQQLIALPYRFLEDRHRVIMFVNQRLYGLQHFAQWQHPKAATTGDDDNADWPKQLMRLEIILFTKLFATKYNVRPVRFCMPIIQSKMLSEYLVEWTRRHTETKEDCFDFVIGCLGFGKEERNKLLSCTDLQNHFQLVDGATLCVGDSIVFCDQSCQRERHHATYLGKGDWCLSKLGIEGVLEIETIDVLHKIYKTTHCITMCPKLLRVKADLVIDTTTR